MATLMGIARHSEPEPPAHRQHGASQTTGQQQPMVRNPLNHGVGKDNVKKAEPGQIFVSHESPTSCPDTYFRPFWIISPELSMPEELRLRQAGTKLRSAVFPGRSQCR
jgi:hypothetical protein